MPVGLTLSGVRPGTEPVRAKTHQVVLFIDISLKKDRKKVKTELPRPPSKNGHHRYVTALPLTQMWKNILVYLMKTGN